MAHPPAPPLVVDESDLTALQAIARAPTSEQRAAIRARIVLRSAEGGTIEGIAAELGVAIMTVKLWRRRYAEAGLEGLVDAPVPVIRRPIPARTVTGSWPWPWDHRPTA